MLLLFHNLGHYVSLLITQNYYNTTYVEVVSLIILSVDGGYVLSSLFGRIGLTTKFPPQLGQTPFNFVSTQSLQKVHSKLHIIASTESGGRSVSQHSQFGFIFNIELLPGIEYLFI